MKRGKILISLFLGLLCIVAGCSQRKVQMGFEDCPVDSLKGEKVSLADSVLMQYPYRVGVCGSVAVIFDLNADSCFCHLFTYPDFRFITSFAPKGEGPEEIVSAGMARFINEDTYGVMDMSVRKLLVYDGVSTRRAPRLRNVVSFSEDVSTPLEFLALPDSTFLIPDYLGEARFCLIGSTGSLLKKEGQIVLADTSALRKSAPAVAQAWRSFLAMDDEGKQIVAVTQLGDVLDSYTLGESITEQVRYVGPDGEPVFQVTPEGYGIPSGCMGYWDVQVTGRYIYALYDGTTFKEIMQSPEAHQQGGTSLRVFDRDGRLVRRYQLDHYLSGFYVDEDRRVLWATDVNTDNGLYRYAF